MCKEPNEKIDDPVVAGNAYNIPYNQVMVNVEEPNSNQSKVIPPSDDIAFDDREDSTKIAAQANESLYINASPEQRKAMRQKIYGRLFPIVSKKNQGRLCVFR